MITITVIENGHPIGIATVDQSPGDAPRVELLLAGTASEKIMKALDRTAGVIGGHLEEEARQAQA